MKKCQRNLQPQEEPKAEIKKEERAEEKKGEEDAHKQQPPSPFVLFVDLHCVGCAKKIERSILKIRGPFIVRCSNSRPSMVLPLFLLNFSLNLYDRH